MKPIKNLLLVDDDETFVFLTKKTIEQTALVEEVNSLGHGKSALDFIKKNISNQHLLPELILLDLSMPIMDGWQFLEEFNLIRPEIEKKIKICILSSSLSPQDIDKAKTINEVSDYIIKPMTKEFFIGLVDRLKQQE